MLIPFEQLIKVRLSIAARFGNERLERSIDHLTAQRAQTCPGQHQMHPGSSRVPSILQHSRFKLTSLKPQLHHQSPKLHTKQLRITTDHRSSVTLLTPYHHLSMQNYEFWEKIPRPWDGRRVPHAMRHYQDLRHQPRDALMHNRLYESYGPGYRTNRDAVFQYNGGWTGGLGQYRYRQQQQRWMLGQDNRGCPPRYGGFY
jgi:hypothetical protein